MAGAEADRPPRRRRDQGIVLPAPWAPPLRLRLRLRWRREYTPTGRPPIATSPATFLRPTRPSSRRAAPIPWMRTHSASIDNLGKCSQQTSVRSSRINPCSLCCDAKSVHGAASVATHLLLLSLATSTMKLRTGGRSPHDSCVQPCEVPPQPPRLPGRKDPGRTSTTSWGQLADRWPSGAR